MNTFFRWAARNGHSRRIQPPFGAASTVRAASGAGGDSERVAVIGGSRGPGYRIVRWPNYWDSRSIPGRRAPGDAPALGCEGSVGDGQAVAGEPWASDRLGLYW